MTGSRNAIGQGEKVLRPVHPNAGIEAEYRKRLERLVAEMQNSVVYWLKASYRANPPEMAEDDTPSAALRRSIRKLQKQWLAQFDEAAPKLADWFSQATAKRSSEALRKILKDGGFTVEFKMTPAMRDIIGATVNQNVTLIKSIPEQYFTQVEGLVMRSVQQGRDLGFLTKELQARYGITRRRAANIALSQNNMATAAFNRARQVEVGIDEAVWVHSGGGHAPRPTHVKAGREKTRYKVAQGWFDPALQRHIQPGEEPGCRCIGRSVVKSFS